MKFEHIFLSGLRTNVGINRNSLLLVVKLNLIKSSIPVLTRTVSGLAVAIGKAFPRIGSFEQFVSKNEFKKRFFTPSRKAFQKRPSKI